MFARYHEEGYDPHHKTPNRNGNPKGDKESNNKAETNKDSGDGIETLTAGPNNLTGKLARDRARQAKDRAEEDDRLKIHGHELTKDPVETEATTDPDQAEKKTKAKHQADDQNPTEEDTGDGNSNPQKTPTGVGAAELNRKAEFVEAQIRKLEDYVGRTKRDIVWGEKRLEELV